MVPPFVGRICPHQFDETAHRNVTLARHIPAGYVVELLRKAHHQADHRLRL